MIFSDILAVVGIVITIIFSVIGIMITIRKRYPGKITFVEENAIGLFNSIIKNFPDIKIQYDDKPIDEQMVYLKASFINTGNTDLTTKDNSHKLKISLSDEFKWINCKLTDSSKDVVCDLQKIDNELVFDFDLLRKNEFLQFEAFAEIKNTKTPASTFRKSLNFSHRIPNTGKVDKSSYLDEEQIKEKRFEFKKNLILATIFLFLGIGAVTYSYFAKLSELEYIYSENGKEYNVKLTADSIDKIKIKDSDKDFEKIISVNNFNQLKTLKANIIEPTWWDHIKRISFVLIYVVMYGVFTIPEFRAIYKDKRIKNIIEKK